MHKLHFSPKWISYALLYSISYTLILAYVTTPQSIGVTPSWIQSPFSYDIFVSVILTWYTYLCLWNENLNLRERDLESLEEYWERERESWREREAKVIHCLRQLLVLEIFFRFGWTSSFSLYFVFLLNNWFLIEEESGWVFPLWVFPWSLT